MLWAGPTATNSSTSPRKATNPPSRSSSSTPAPTTTPSIRGYTVNGVDNAGKNDVVRQFAASRPGTQVPEWAGWVHAHPELMMSDGLHPEPEGSEARAQLIARGILGCLGGAATSSAAPPSGREDRPLKPRLATVDAM